MDAIESQKEEGKNNLFIWVATYHISCLYRVLQQKKCSANVEIKKTKTKNKTTKKLRTENEVGTFHRDSKKESKDFSIAYEVNWQGAGKEEIQELKFPSEITTLKW